MNVINIDATSNNGVDNIYLKSEERRSPTVQQKDVIKVYIIDEVHYALSIRAF